MPSNQFNNTILAAALKAMRANQNQDTLLKAVQALLDTKILAPAKWDKEPVKAEDGSMNFDPDTKLSLMIVAGNDGSKYFPMFTSMDEVKNFYGSNPINCLILNIDQYLPFVEAAKEEVKGIVVDPAGADVPFQTEFLQGVRKAYKQPLNQNTIRKGTKIWLRNPDEDIHELEAALISGGFNESAVKAIYLKERVENPEEPDKRHWFIVIDADELDTGIFSRIGERAKNAAKGKELEFIFTDQKIARQVADTSEPLYTRAV